MVLQCNKRSLAALLAVQHRKIHTQSISPSTCLSTMIHFYRTVTRQFTLCIPSARQHCDGFSCSRQVFKEYFLGVWLRHFHSGSVYIPILIDKIKEWAQMMKGNTRPLPLYLYMPAMLSFSLFRIYC